ncbi:hypothetical protein GCM10022248_90350 [Nonomuraea soli]
METPARSAKRPVGPGSGAIAVPGGTPDWAVSRRLGHAHVQTTLDLYGWVSEDAALRTAANWKQYIKE